MTIFRLLLAAMLSMLACSASAQDVKFTSARPSPLKQADTIEPNETTFTGTVQVTGTFETRWEPSSEGSPGYYRVVLKPDKASQKILPHDSQRGPVREIWLRNTDKSVRALLTQAQRKAIRSSRIHHATGQVTVLLTSYRTGVDCDQRGYNALLVKTIKPSSNVATNAPLREFTGGR